MQNILMQFMNILCFVISESKAVQLNKKKKTSWMGMDHKDPTDHPSGLFLLLLFMW